MESLSEQLVLATLYLGPTRVMAYSYLYPPFILILDWFFGHQLPALQTLPGIALIVAAMFIVQQGADDYYNAVKS